MTIYSTSEAATELRVSSRRIRKICEQLKIRKSRDYIITASDLKAIRGKIKRKSKISQDSA